MRTWRVLLGLGVGLLSVGCVKVVRVQAEEPAKPAQAAPVVAQAAESPTLKHEAAVIKAAAPVAAPVAPAAASASPAAREAEGNDVVLGMDEALARLPRKPAAPEQALPAQAEAPAKPVAKPRCKWGMVGIPSGTFTMGDAENFQKPGTVTVAAFCMDRTEVTVSAYKVCVKSGKCTAANTGDQCNAGFTGREFGRWSRDNHPINCVDWNQATAYCEAQGQRLPTEEEWEYAARGTDGRIYPWGNAEPAGQLCWDGAGNDLGEGNRKSTCPVASFPAGNSPFGLADMSGNVMEWTSSGDSSREVRGGGFLIRYTSVHSARRDSNTQAFQDATWGFRCAGSPRP